MSVPIPKQASPADRSHMEYFNELQSTHQRLSTEIRRLRDLVPDVLSQKNKQALEVGKQIYLKMLALEQSLHKIQALMEEALITAVKARQNVPQS